MSDTPETDSLLEGEGTQCSVNIVKLLDLCRKMERERNEKAQPPARNCRECCGQGQVEIQSGPYMRKCPECNGTGKQNNQTTKP